MQKLTFHTVPPRFGNHFIAQFDGRKIQESHIRETLTHAILHPDQPYAALSATDRGVQIALGHAQNLPHKIKISTKRSQIQVVINTNAIETSAPVQEAVNHQVSKTLRALPGFESLHEFLAPPSKWAWVRRLFDSAPSSAP